MKVICSALAVEQVQDITSYIALEKTSVAMQWAEKIFNSVKPLSEFSNNGRIAPEINGNGIRRIVNGNYGVLY